MTEKIAMTPPDRDGNQVIWEKRETDNGTLYLPDSANSTAVNLLVPGNYVIDASRDDTLLGMGSVDCYVEAGVVHREGDFAVKSAPFTSEERMLDWLRANLMLRQAIISLPRKGKDYITRKVMSGLHKIKTPEYFGALSLDGCTGKSLIIMSDESRKSGRVMNSSTFRKVDARLLGITMRSMESLYPESWTKWDHHEQNWIYRPSDRTLVRLDLYGTKDEEYPWK